MDPLTEEWVSRAEGDATTCDVLLATGRLETAGAIGFHAQQCAEKYLKARLHEARLPVPRIHDLVVLLHQVAAVEPKWATWRSSLTFLSGFAVDRRYPGAPTTWPEAERATEICRQFRAAARQALGLPT